MPPIDLTIMGILTENKIQAIAKALAKVAKFAQKRHFCPCEFVRNSSPQTDVNKVLHPDGRLKLYLCLKCPCSHRSAVHLVGSGFHEPPMPKTPPLWLHRGGSSLLWTRTHPPTVYRLSKPQRAEGHEFRAPQGAPRKFPPPLYLGSRDGFGRGIESEPQSNRTAPRSSPSPCLL